MYLGQAAYDPSSQAYCDENVDDPACYDAGGFYGPGGGGQTGSSVTCTNPDGSTYSIPMGPCPPPSTGVVCQNADGTVYTIPTGPCPPPGYGGNTGTTSPFTLPVQIFKSFIPVFQQATGTGPYKPVTPITGGIVGGASSILGGSSGLLILAAIGAGLYFSRKGKA